MGKKFNIFNAELTTKFNIIYIDYFTFLYQKLNPFLFTSHKITRLRITTLLRKYDCTKFYKIKSFENYEAKS